jgi:hypothetical protein
MSPQRDQPSSKPRPAEQPELDHARLEGVLLAARTAQHTVNNLLTLTVGYAELVANDPRLPEDLREPAGEALRGAMEAVTILGRLLRVTHVEVIEVGLPGGTVLDLDRCAPNEASAAD